MPAAEPIVEDVEYARPDGIPLLGRLYGPRAGKPIAAIVEIHGGGWTNGTRLDNAPLAEKLAAADVLVMAVDFRQPPVASYPASLADIHAAIRWLKAYAASLDIDPRRVGGIGGSSGGHQLMLGAMRPFDPKFAGTTPSKGANNNATLGFAVACWPVIDPVRRYAMAKEKGRQELVDSHHAFWGSEARMAEGSPQAILDRGEATHLPPTLIVQGTADENTDHRWADRFAQSYRAAGGEITLRKYEGQVHAFIKLDMETPAAVECVGEIIAFVGRQATRPL